MGMLDALKKVTTRATPQSEKILGSTQVPNSAGGFAWPVTDQVRLDRFLILGSEGGSYYSTERALTLDNAEAVLRAIEADGPAVVQRVVEISEAGRAPKNDPAIFVLALAASRGDEATRRAAFEALPRKTETMMPPTTRHSTAPRAARARGPSLLALGAKMSSPALIARPSGSIGRAPLRQ